MASMQTPRSYHSTSLLLPDGRVLVAGSGRLGTMTDRFNAEILSPPYLFKGPRPKIASVQGAIGYGSAVFVETPDAAAIASVSLVRPRAVPHLLRPQPAIRSRLVRTCKRRPDCAVAGQWQHRAARLLQAVPGKHQRCALRGDVRPVASGVRKNTAARGRLDHAAPPDGAMSRA